MPIYHHSSLARLASCDLAEGPMQKYHHDNSLGPCTLIHLISTLFPPTYDMRWLIDGKFRGVASKIGGVTSIAMFRGGQRQNSRGADSKYQY